MCSGCSGGWNEYADASEDECQDEQATDYCMTDRDVYEYQRLRLRHLAIESMLKEAK